MALSPTQIAQFQKFVERTKQVSDRIVDYAEDFTKKFAELETKNEEAHPYLHGLKEVMDGFNKDGSLFMPIVCFLDNIDYLNRLLSQPKYVTYAEVKAACVIIDAQIKKFNEIFNLAKKASVSNNTVRIAMALREISLCIEDKTVWIPAETIN